MSGAFGEPHVCSPACAGPLPPCSSHHGLDGQQAVPWPGELTRPPATRTGARPSPPARALRVGPGARRLPGGTGFAKSPFLFPWSLCLKESDILSVNSPTNFYSLTGNKPLKSQLCVSATSVGRPRAALRGPGCELSVGPPPKNRGPHWAPGVGVQVPALSLKLQDQVGTLLACPLPLPSASYFQFLVARGTEVTELRSAHHAR